MNKRKARFCQSTWQALNKTYKQLYVDYIYENSEHVVGHGTFLALKPFYVRPVKNMTSKCAAAKASTSKMVH